MPQTIARMYHNNEAASAAAKELRDRGLPADAVCVVGPTEGTSTDAVVSSLTAVGIPTSHAAVYADGIVNRGQALTGAIPPFGYGRIANDVLDRHHPIEVDLPGGGPSATTSATGPATSTDVGEWSANPAPLSSALGWATLLSDPAPFSRWLGWATLKTDPPSPALENIRRQSDDAAPLSSKLGMSVISHDPAPLSSKLGLRVLSEQSAPRAELSDDPAPLSSKFGWRTLSDDPAPLSRLLGWKVLSDRQ